MDAAELLGQLLLQDVERAEGGVSLAGLMSGMIRRCATATRAAAGVTGTRRLVVDTDSQLITAVACCPATWLAGVERGQHRCTGRRRLGDGATRQTFADAPLVARVPGGGSTFPGHLATSGVVRRMPRGGYTACRPSVRRGRLLRSSQPRAGRDDVAGRLQEARALLQRRLRRISSATRGGGTPPLVPLRQSRYFGRVKTRFQLWWPT